MSMTKYRINRPIRRNQLKAHLTLCKAIVRTIALDLKANRYRQRIMNQHLRLRIS